MGECFQPSTPWPSTSASGRTALRPGASNGGVRIGGELWVDFQTSIRGRRVGMGKDKRPGPGSCWDPMQMVHQQMGAMSSKFENFGG